MRLLGFLRFFFAFLLNLFSFLIGQFRNFGGGFDDLIAEIYRAENRTAFALVGGAVELYFEFGDEAVRAVGEDVDGDRQQFIFFVVRRYVVNFAD